MSNEVVTGYIPDGFTRSGYIAGVKGLYGDVRFQYRPLTYGLKKKVFHTLPDLDADAIAERLTTVLSKQIESWDLKSPNGDKVLDCKEATVYRRLTTSLFARLMNIVSEDDTSDEDPLEAQPEKKDDLGFLDQTQPGNSQAV